MESNEIGLVPHTLVTCTGTWVPVSGAAGVLYFSVSLFILFLVIRHRTSNMKNDAKTVRREGKSQHTTTITTTVSYIVNEPLNKK